MNIIITEKSVIEVTSEGLVLKENATNITIDKVKACTEADLRVSPDLKFFNNAA